MVNLTPVQPVLYGAPHYCFLVVDVGRYGHSSDGGIFRNSNFSKALHSGSMQLPAASRLVQKLDLGNTAYCTKKCIADALFLSGS